MVDYKITKTEFGERPKFDLPNVNFLKTVSEDGFTEMMNDFYDLVIESDIANFFPQEKAEIDRIKHHNTKFFIEACGGTKDYTHQMGHADMIKMHEEFSIPDKARIIWLACWKELLPAVQEKYGVSDEDMQSYWDYLEIFSKHLVNVDVTIDQDKNW